MARCIHCESYEVSEPGMRCSGCQFWVDQGGDTNPTALTLADLQIDDEEDR